jgi:hypothetical protein
MSDRGDRWRSVIPTPERLAVGAPFIRLKHVRKIENIPIDTAVDYICAQ